MLRRALNAVPSFAGASRRRPLLMLLIALPALFLAGPACIFLGSTLPPANRPVRGPGSFHHPDRYDSTYNVYKSYEGYSMEGVRQFESGFWSILGGWRLGLIYGSVSMPIMATPVPRGSMVMERAATCILWVCFEDDALERQNKRNKMAAVSSVDGRVTTVLFGMYSRRSIVYTGWSQADWEKSGGATTAPPTEPALAPAPVAPPAPPAVQEKPPAGGETKPPAAQEPAPAKEEIRVK